MSDFELEGEAPCTLDNSYHASLLLQNASKVQKVPSLLLTLHCLEKYHYRH